LIRQETNIFGSYDKVDKDIREVFHKMTGEMLARNTNEMTYLLQGYHFLYSSQISKKENLPQLSGGEKTCSNNILLALQTLKPPLERLMKFESLLCFKHQRCKNT